MAFPHTVPGRGCFLEEGVHELDQGREVREQVQGDGEQGRPPGGSGSRFKERGRGLRRGSREGPKELTAM